MCTVVPATLVPSPASLPLSSIRVQRSRTTLSYTRQLQRTVQYISFHAQWIVFRLCSPVLLLCVRVCRGVAKEWVLQGSERAPPGVFSFVAVEDT